MPTPIDISAVMFRAKTVYPEDGYCFERACFIREALGYGSVATFSLTGLSLKHDKSINTKLLTAPSLIIPHHIQYTGTVEWAYHSVYEFNNTVFTYEVPDLIVPLNIYRKELDNLNAKYLAANNKKHVIMRYEKQN